MSGWPRNQMAAGLFEEALTSVDQAIVPGGERVDPADHRAERGAGAGDRSTILEEFDRPEDALASAAAKAEHARRACG